jgi:hypothetical protein
MRKLLLPLFSMAFFKSPIVICSIALLVSWTHYNICIGAAVLSGVSSAAQCMVQAVIV